MAGLPPIGAVSEQREGREGGREGGREEERESERGICARAGERRSESVSPAQLISSVCRQALSDNSVTNPKSFMLNDREGGGGGGGCE